MLILVQPKVWEYITSGNEFAEASTQVREQVIVIIYFISRLCALVLMLYTLFIRYGSRYASVHLTPC